MLMASMLNLDQIIVNVCLKKGKFVAMGKKRQQLKRGELKNWLFILSTVDN